MGMTFDELDEESRQGIKTTCEEGCGEGIKRGKRKICNRCHATEDLHVDWICPDEEGCWEEPYNEGSVVIRVKDGVAVYMRVTDDGRFVPLED